MDKHMATEEEQNTLNEAYRVKAELIKTGLESVYALFFDNESLSKPQIAKLLGLSMPTVLAKTGKLENLGLIKKGKEQDSNGGRRAIGYELNSIARVAIGVEINAQKVRFCCVDLKGKSYERKSVELAFNDGYSYLDDFVKELKAFINSLKFDEDRILGIGISLQAVVANDGEQILYSKIMPLQNIIAKQLERLIGIKVRFSHDVECAALTELWHEKEVKDSIFVSISEHLGGCLISNHLIEHGLHGYAGALEHMELHENGVKCYCGKDGCVESYCSLNALLRGESDEDFFKKLKSGDDEAKSRYQVYLNDLARALYSVYLLLEREIIIGGGMADFVTDEDVNYLEEKIIERSSFKVEKGFIHIASVRKDASVIGAALPYIANFVPDVIVPISI